VATDQVLKVKDDTAVRLILPEDSEKKLGGKHVDEVDSACSHCLQD
jgi:hypothetical protein